MKDRTTNMSYKSEFDVNNKVCLINVCGSVRSPDDAEQLRYLAVNLHSSKGYRNFLFDMTNANILSSTLAAYKIANPTGELAHKLRVLKGAILYQKITGHERFFENVAVNRGFRIKVFDERDSAIDWLSN